MVGFAMSVHTVLFKSLRSCYQKKIKNHPKLNSILILKAKHLNIEYECMMFAMSVLFWLSRSCVVKNDRKKIVGNKRVG